MRIRRSTVMGSPMRGLVYHLFGYSYACPLKPKGADMFGSNHGVTDFPEMVNCEHCKHRLDLLKDSGTVECDEEGRLKSVPVFNSDGKEIKTEYFTLIGN